MIRVVALDFDGVVVESVGLKLEAFKRLFSGHPRSPEIWRYLEEQNGIDRFTKFRFIWTQMLGRRYDSEVEARLDSEFSGMVLEAVARCPFVAGAEAFLRGTTLPLYVVSAMPLRELRLIVERRELADFFRGLYGSPGRKADQLREILAVEKAAASEMAFVGDSVGDRKAAAEAGVHFVGRRNAEDFGECGTPVIPDLRGLSQALAALAAGAERPS
jgi:phosphoglycolate phosphatase-like HAD superfamily hydrolase